MSYKGKTIAEKWVEGAKKRNKLTLVLFACHSLTVLSAEEVANIGDPDRNLTSKMASKCVSDVVKELPVSM